MRGTHHHAHVYARTHPHSNSLTLKARTVAYMNLNLLLSVAVCRVAYHFYALTNNMIYVVWPPRLSPECKHSRTLAHAYHSHVAQCSAKRMRACPYVHDSDSDQPLACGVARVCQSREGCVVARVGMFFYFLFRVADFQQPRRHRQCRWNIQITRTRMIYFPLAMFNQAFWSCACRARAR